jgi:hypothetical protein
MRFSSCFALAALFGAGLFFAGCGSEEPTELFTLVVPQTGKTVSADTADVKFEIFITNNTAAPLDMTWERTDNSIPRTDGWATAFCDINMCYTPTTNTQMFVLPANATDTLFLHFYPNGFASTGTATIELFKTADRAGTAQSVTANLTAN